MNLQGARVLITGGSSGIGKATAVKLAAAGAKVLITARNESRLRAVAEEHELHYLVADVSSADDVARTFDEVHKKLGGLDVLINNAGIAGDFDKLEALDTEDFYKVYGINVFGAAMMAQKAAELFIKQQSGHIINIASTAGQKGFANGTVYASSKFALRGMTQCWQAELRPHNIRVMLVNPSEVVTEFGNWQHDKVNKKLRGEEIAHAIKAALEMDDRGFVPELTVWATNPW